MKSAQFVVMALLGLTSAYKLQEETIYDPEYYAGLYTNVLLDVDAFKRHHGIKHHKNKDEYDSDPNTVSPYDADAQFAPSTNKERQDWFDEAKKHQNQKIYDLQINAQNLHQRPKRDAYDSDKNTASPYDAANNINGGNPLSKSAYTDNDAPIGPPEPDLIAAIKKGYWWDKELEKEMKMPAGPGQADARTGFAGAIPKDKSGADYCEGVGATCDAGKVQADAVKEAKAEAAEENSEAKKEGEKIVAEEKAKAEKKEKGEGPKEEVVEEKAEEKPAALHQMKSKHHKKKHHHHHHKRH